MLNPDELLTLGRAEFDALLGERPKRVYVIVSKQALMPDRRWPLKASDADVAIDSMLDQVGQAVAGLQPLAPMVFCPIFLPSERLRSSTARLR